MTTRGVNMNCFFLHDFPDFPAKKKNVKKITDKPLMGLEPTTSAYDRYIKLIGKQRTTIVLQWPNCTLQILITISTHPKHKENYLINS